MKLAIVFYVLWIAATATGWVLSVIKFVKSDFEAPYKREVVYGLGTFTGVGGIVGWLNIED